MIVQAIGGELGKFNYVAFSSGGEVLAQTLGGHVTVGLGGYNEFAAQITVRQAARAGDHLDKRLPGVNIPTLKEQGIDVEFVNWRGLMAAPGISDAQRQALVKAVTQMVKIAAVESHVKKNEWLDLSWAATSSRPTSRPSRRTVRRNDSAGEDRDASGSWSQRNERAFAPRPAPRGRAPDLAGAGRARHLRHLRDAEHRRDAGLRAGRPAAVSLHHRRRPRRCAARCSAGTRSCGGWRNVPLDQDGHDAPGLDGVRHHQRRHRAAHGAHRLGRLHHRVDAAVRARSRAASAASGRCATC